MGGWSDILRGTRRALAASGVVVVALTSTAGRAAEPPAARPPLGIAVLAATCVTCHAPATAPGGIPLLEGLDRALMLARLRAFKAIDPAQATTTSTIMPLLLQGYDDDELQALATWFAARKAAP